jgi:glutathione S-transferase
MLLYLPAVVTLLTVLLLLGNMYAVGAARKKYDIKAPATTGSPGFERAYRVQMNTLENTVMFLPVLWLAAMHGYAAWAGIAGLFWVVGRIWYSFAYLQDAGKRGPGFGLAFFAWAVVFVLAVIGVVRAIMVS